ncbi:MAG: peptide deformylase [Pseudomonadota bacterium]
MSVREIIEYPDPRLSRAAGAVTDFDEPFKRFVGDLTDTLGTTSGLGLAAPQLGASLAVFALRDDESSAADVYVNPQILDRAGFCVVEERCLSVPGVSANVFRAAAVLVRAQDANGAVFERELSGMPAVCFQHELDHLEGRVFLDRLSTVRRWWATMRRRPESAATEADSAR